MLTPDAPIHPLSVEDVWRMAEVGVLRQEDRVELVDGVLVDVSPSGPAHSAVVAWLTRHFVAAVEHGEVRIQDLLLVEGGFLVPDLMVLDQPHRDRQPSTAALVIEVAVTTQRYDAAKAARYAAAGVPEYWLVDVPARRVDVRRTPQPTGYAEITCFGDGEQVATDVLAPAVDVSAMLDGSRPAST